MRNAPNRARRLAGVVLATTACAGAPHSLAKSGGEIEEVVVRADASLARRPGVVGSLSVLDADTIERARASHPNELFTRVPGVWVTRNSGQEHLTAIRSAVHAGAGACGEFLLLENGIPIRPAGFCNVNNLFELNIEQAAAVETVRGPASALFGGNALHGVINTITATRAAGWRGSVEAGAYGFAQLRLTGGNRNWRVDAHATNSGGYRADTGYAQQKATFGASAAIGGWEVANTGTVTSLEQETGGYVLGHRAYDSPARRGNPNPQAYRNAWAGRAASVWRRAWGNRKALVVTPFARRSSMAFRQHFLPGQPLEKNAQTSGGVRLDVSCNGDRQWNAGVVLEAFDAQLTQRQKAPTAGSAFLAATRPPGVHYDYRIDGRTLAAFYDARLPLGARLALVTSARAERNSYRYDNRHIDGNTRDDGTVCPFGGCLYTRPRDRDDAFTNLAGRLGLAWSSNARKRYYLTVGQGFRPPQTTELYRLQRGQTVADLDTERLRSVEAGVRGTGTRISYDLAVYAQTTTNLIFRDARGFNVSDGKTESTGVEAQVGLNRANHAIDLVATYADHRYAFTRDGGFGERIADGNTMDTAPRWLASLHWRWQNDSATSELEIAHVGAHFLNAANTARYGGHTLVNWRGAWRANANLKLFARLMNLTNTAYAERADYAFGNYRYFPGMPRQLYVGLEVGGG